MAELRFEDPDPRTLKEILDSVNEVAVTLDYMQCRAIQEDIAEIANRFAAGGWISVDDALPETDDDVLCWYEYYHWNSDKILPEYGIGRCYNGRWTGEVANGISAKVLAWIPLPKPPIVEVKDDA